MKGNEGITLIEVMIVIAIITALAVIGTPSFLTWKANQALSGETRNLKGIFELARSRAIRDSDNITVEFDPANNRYEIKDGVGTIQSRTLAHADIDSAVPAATTFDSRGRASNAINVTIGNTSGTSQVSVGLIGTVRIN